MIRGGQLLYVIKGFYAVRTANPISFELQNLCDYAYAGDTKLPRWTTHWDRMVRDIRFPLAPEQLEEIYLPKLRGSDVLRAHIEYYDRLVDGHPDKPYQFLSSMTDNTINDRRQRFNQESLANSVAGTKKTGAPATQEQQPPGGSAGGNGGAGGKGGKDGKGKGKDGKGKGKGKHGDAGDTSGTDPKGKGKSGDAAQKTCVYALFGKCNSDTPMGQSCKFGKHKSFPSKTDRELKWFTDFEKKVRHVGWIDDQEGECWRFHS